MKKILIAIFIIAIINLCLTLYLSISRFSVEANTYNKSDTAINHVRIDSIQLVITERESVVYKLKEHEKELLVLMTVLLGSYSRSWCQSEIDNVVHPPRGVNTIDTTVLVPINMIKIANTKIIKAKLYKDIINEQDSIINLHKIKYNALYKEVETLQNNLDNSNKVNDNLNKSIERIKRKNRYLVSGGAVCAIAFVVCLLVK